VFARISFRIAIAYGIALALVAAAVSWAAVHHAEAATAARAAKPTVAFLGDSYTAGTGDVQYWVTTSGLMCWNGRNLGKSGTGYLNPGKYPAKGGTFSSRIDAVVAVKPSIVIVQGSFNDKAPEAVEPAAVALFDALHKRLPHAELFAMSPVSRPKPGSAALVESNTAAVRKAAQETHVNFIDARKFVTVDPADFRKDLQHPNAKGHKMIGKNLAASLPKRLNACH